MKQKLPIVYLAPPAADGSDLRKLHFVDNGQPMLCKGKAGWLTCTWMCNRYRESKETNRVTCDGEPIAIVDQEKTKAVLEEPAKHIITKPIDEHLADVVDMLVGSMLNLTPKAGASDTIPPEKPDLHRVLTSPDAPAPFISIGPSRIGGDCQRGRFK